MASITGGAAMTKTKQGRNSDADRAAEISETVVSSLTTHPPDKLWPSSRRRKLFRHDREEALRRAYVVGIQNGALAAQRYLDEQPSRLVAIERELREGRAPNLPLIGLALDKTDFADISEYLAASERYGAGHGLGYMRLIRLRLLTAPDGRFDAQHR
jgi:hypothetical protein